MVHHFGTPFSKLVYDDLHYDHVVHLLFRNLFCTLLIISFNKEILCMLCKLLEQSDETKKILQ